MGAAVRIEAEAFADERYATLARLAGLADPDHARGKMLRLWRQCTDRCTHTLSVELIASVLGDNGADALVKSDLGERADGGIRIRGTSGRIEWLEKLRKNGRKGGKAKAKHLLGKSVALQEKEMEKEQERESPLFSSEALSAADALRTEIVSQQPTHKLAHDWSASARRAWAKRLDEMHRRDHRGWDEIADVIRWLFHGQTSQYRFVVQSPASLAEKWDRIAEARGRPAANNQSGLDAAMRIARGEQ